MTRRQGLAVTFSLALCWMMFGTETARANVSAATVTVANPLIGVVTQYSIQFTTTVTLTSQDQIIITFPAGTSANATARTNILVNGSTPSSLQKSGQTFNIQAGLTINPGSITVVFRNPPGVVNPLTPGPYTISVSTTKEPTIVSSNPYTITATAVLTSATITLTSSVVGKVSGYQLEFTLGGAGALTGGAGTITVVFPTGTSTNTIVPNGQIYGITINGTPAAGIGTSSTRTMTVQTPIDLANQQAVTLAFALSSGLVNPAPAATYTLTVATSVETSPITSNPYTLFDGTTLTPASVDITPNTVNTAAEYMISAQLGLSGGLTGNVDNIFIGLPANTIVPGTIATSNVLVDNGTFAAPAASVTTIPNAQQINVVPSNDIPSGGTATVTIKVNAGVINPILVANYTLDMATSKEDTVTSNSYLTSTATTTITTPTVAPSPTSRGSVAQYTISFNVGDQGRLLAGTSTITIVFPTGTTIGSAVAGTPSNTTVNGVAATTVTTNVSTRTVTVTVPASVNIGNNGAVTVVFANATNMIINPNSNVTVNAQVSTSVEPIQVSSSNYIIGTGGTTATFDSITLGTSTVNTVSQYTIFFTPTNRVEVADHIIITFPYNTTLPSSMLTTNIQITPNGGVAAPALSVTTNPSARQIDLQTNAQLVANKSHKIDILSGAGVRNPSVPQTTYTMALRTQDQATDLISPTYSITASATAVTVNSVTVSPARAGLAGSYAVKITVGAAGALLIGNNTITATFPAGTTVPSIIPASTISLNNVTASTVTTVPASRTVTITTPVTVANSDTALINFGVTAGILNPSAATYTLQVKTSAETTNGTSPSYTITSNTTLSVSSALPNPAAINANAGYVITFQVGSASPLSIGDQITVDFPSGTGVPALMSAGDVQINNTAVTVAPFTDAISKKVTVTTPVAIAANGTVNLSFTNAAGLTNPPTTGSYTLNVSTNIQPTPQASPSYTISAATTTVGNASVTPNFGSVSQLATYTVVFNVGAQGALQAGSSTITIVFNASTTLGTIQANNVTVNGVQTQTVSKSGQTVTVTVPPGVTISNNSAVTVVIGSSAAAITNPAVAGNYTLTVNTSVETTPIPSLIYSIGTSTTTVSPATVTPNPNTVGNTAQYTVAFNVGSSGALTTGVSTITVTFPNNTSVPFSIAANQITVNGTPVSVTPTASPTARSVTFTTPVSVANSGAVTVVFASGAGILNPSTGGSYTLQVNTSVEQTKVSSQAYTILAPVTTVTAATVTPSPNGVNSAAQYTIAFNVGSSGALQGGVSTITLIMPTGTTVPTSIAPSKITVNGTAAAAVSISGQQIVLTVPATVTIPNSGAVSLVISAQASVLNPSVSGSYTLQVATSSEPTAVTSNPYTIGPATTTVTAATVSPDPATVTATAAYTVTFNVGSSGALQAGSSSITLTFNASTSVATQTISGATVNGVSASAASDATARTVVLTVPASVTVGNNGSVTVVIPSGVITNPNAGGTYTLQVKTSVENTNVTSNGYVVTTATTTVTAATVTPSPATANAAAQYTVAFNVGAQGALTAGSSTMTVTFPNNTNIPASITPANITVNSTPVAAAVTTDPTLRTVTFTTPVNVANSGAVSVIFLAAAGLVNPSTSSFTLQVRTSVEGTNVTSNAYSITAATTTITTPSVSVSPSIVETNASYTVSFSVGASGRLLAQTSTITTTFPAGTTVPAAIAGSNVTVNGTAATAVSVSGQAVTVTVPAAVLINNNSSVVLVFKTAAGLYNPTTATSHTLSVSTSTEPTAVTSSSYAISTSSTTTAQATVIPNPGQTSTAAQYTVSFNTGGVGALQPGVSTIILTFNASTTVGTIAASNISVNSVTAPTASKTGQAVTVTVPSSVAIGNNGNVNVVIGTSSNVITNPASAGSYTLTVRTSVETTDITSNAYTISNATTTVDSALVGPNGTTPTGGPNPQTVNTTAQYDITFHPGAQGALTAGSSQITVTFPSNTVVPTSIIASFITVNGTALAVAPTCNAALRTVTLTTPVSVVAGGTATVRFLTGALIQSPSLTGTYRLSVRTSVESTNIPSKLYTINPATTTASAATVTPTPNTFGANAQYRIDVSTGAQGTLVAGTSTVQVTFPAGTLVPSAIAASTVTFNSVTATTVSADSVNRRVTVTIPASVSVGNNGAITLILSASAGLVNPNPGTVTLTVATSVEGTVVASNAYTINSLTVLQTKSKLSLHGVWSPSDARLAYLSEAPDDGSGAQTGNWNLFTIKSDGTNKTQVTTAISGSTNEDGDPIHFSSFTWTPDGDSLVYAGYQRQVIGVDTVLTVQLFQIPAAGGPFKKISPKGAKQDTTKQYGGWLDPDWAVTTYAFEAAQFPSGVHRIVASLDGNIWVFEPRNLAYDGPGPGTFKNLVQITNLPTSRTKTDGLFEPKWSPDRKKLAVVYKDSTNATLSDIYVIANVDSIIQKTLQSPNYSRYQFDYNTEVGTNAVTALSNMTKITIVGNTKPSWTPSWSTDGTQIAYSQDQAVVFNNATFGSNPYTSITSSNFYVKLRNSNGTGTDSTLIGQASANNAFPAMTNNGQRFAYFQAGTSGPFSQSQKVFYLQTTGKFAPPPSPKVLPKRTIVTWRLADFAFSAVEFPVTAISHTVTLFIAEPLSVPSTTVDGARYLGVARQFGPEEMTFSEPALVTVHYTDGELRQAGLVKGSPQESQLALFTYDTPSQAWTRVEGSVVDPVHNVVSGPVTRLGTFGVFYISPAQRGDFSQVMVYPNPFKPNSGDANRGTYDSGVIFDLLPSNLKFLNIYNIAGDWVASLGHAIVPTGVPGQMRWRGVNDSGERVASGIYIYVIENQDGKRKTGKVAVIR